MKLTFIAVILELIAALIAAIPLAGLTNVLYANGNFPHPWSYGTSFGVLVLLVLVSVPFIVMGGVASLVVDR